LNHREKLLRKLYAERPKILYIDSLVFSKLVTTIDNQEYKKRKFIKFKMGECDKMILFAHNNTNHWVLFEVIVKTRQITIYDSYFHNNQVALSQANHLIEFLVYNISSTIINDWTKTFCTTCQFQTNHKDCGVYMLTFGLFLADCAVENVDSIDCEKLARLKISLDITRGYIEDPRLNQTLTEDLSGK
jgi:Ulp1 family protease